MPSEKEEQSPRNLAPIPSPRLSRGARAKAQKEDILSGIESVVISEIPSSVTALTEVDSRGLISYLNIL